MLAAVKDYVTITKDAATLDSVPCAKVNLNIKLPKGEVGKFMTAAMSKIPESFKAGMSNIDTKMFDNMELDSTFTFYVDAEHTPLRIDEGINISGVSFGGMDLGVIKINSNTAFAVSTDKLSIPADRVEKAIVAPGYITAAGSVTVTSNINNKGSFFIVTEVTKTGAKKITIPASVTAFEKTYKITQAADNAFKKAKKLKTLIVKNAALKKALKKNPSKYGLSKKVTIK